jgi:hypothetical protein
MCTRGAAPAFRDRGRNVANELPAALAQADARAVCQAKVSRVVGTEIHLADVTEDKRQVAENTILRICALPGASVLNLGGVVSTIHAWRDVPNVEWLAAEWAVSSLHN